MNANEGKLTFGLRWCFVATALASVAVASYVTYRSVSVSAQASLVCWYGVAMMLSPLLFAFLTPTVYERPALLLLTWWIVPLAMIWIGFKHTISESSNSPMAGLFLTGSSFAALFLPVVIGGIVRSKKNRTNRRDG